MKYLLIIYLCIPIYTNENSPQLKEESNDLKISNKDHKTEKIFHQENLLDKENNQPINEKSISIFNTPQESPAHQSNIIPQENHSIKTTNQPTNDTITEHLNPFTNLIDNEEIIYKNDQFIEENIEKYKKMFHKIKKQIKIQQQYQSEEEKKTKIVSYINNNISQELLFLIYYLDKFNLYLSFKCYNNSKTIYTNNTLTGMVNGLRNVNIELPNGILKLFFTFSQINCFFFDMNFILTYFFDLLLDKKVDNVPDQNQGNKENYFLRSAYQSVGVFCQIILIDNFFSQINGNLDFNFFYKDLNLSLLLNLRNYSITKIYKGFKERNKYSMIIFDIICLNFLHFTNEEFYWNLSQNITPNTELQKKKFLNIINKNKLTELLFSIGLQYNFLLEHIKLINQWRYNLFLYIMMSFKDMENLNNIWKKNNIQKIITFFITNYFFTGFMINYKFYCINFFYYKNIITITIALKLTAIPQILPYEIKDIILSHKLITNQNHITKEVQTINEELNL